MPGRSAPRRRRHSRSAWPDLTWRQSSGSSPTQQACRSTHGCARSLRSSRSGAAATPSTSASSGTTSSTDGAVSFDDGVVSVLEGPPSAAVPEGVREVVGERLARLSPPARQVVDLAALAGYRVDLQVLEEASDMSTDDLDAAIAELVNAGVLVQVGGTALVYRFAHALVQDCAASAMTRQARGRLHLTLARGDRDRVPRPTASRSSPSWRVTTPPREVRSTRSATTGGAPQGRRCEPRPTTKRAATCPSSSSTYLARSSAARCSWSSRLWISATLGSRPAAPPPSRRSRSPPSWATPKQQPTPRSPTRCRCTSRAFPEARGQTCSAPR